MALALAKGAEHFEVNGFTLYIWPKSDVFYRSLALPSSKKSHDTYALDRLKSEFRLLKREPRLEFFDESWPGLQNAGLANEWVVENRLSAMWLAPIQFKGAATGCRWLAATAPDDLLISFLDGMAKAFDVSFASDTDEARRLRSGIDAGHILAAFVFEHDEVVAGAALTQQSGIAELQGVWVTEDQRGRGLGERICRFVLAGFFNHGGQMAWLSAAPGPSYHIYQKLGFKPMGTQINMSAT